MSEMFAVLDNPLVRKRKSDLSSILSEFNHTLPEYLVILLSCNGYDNEISLSKMNETAINNLEMFARTKLSQILSQNEKIEFFGMFAFKTELFEIVQGDKHLLYSLRDVILVKQKTSQKKQKPDGNPKTRTKNISETNNDSVSDSVNEKKNNNEDSDTEKGDSEVHVEPHSNPNHHNSSQKAEEFVYEQIQQNIKNYSTNLPRNLKEACIALAKEITVNVNLSNHTAKIKCSKCNFLSTAYHAIRKNGSRRWIPSNFLKHFKTHFKLPQIEPQIKASKESKKVQQGLDKFLKTKENRDNEEIDSEVEYSREYFSGSLEGSLVGSNSPTTELNRGPDIESNLEIPSTSLERTEESTEESVNHYELMPRLMPKVMLSNDRDPNLAVHPPSGVTINQFLDNDDPLDDPQCPNLSSNQNTFFLKSRVTDEATSEASSPAVKKLSLPKVRNINDSQSVSPCETSTNIPDEQPDIQYEVQPQPSESSENSPNTAIVTAIIPLNPTKNKDWRNQIYSRSARHIRSLRSFSEDQSMITDYYDKIIKIVEDHKEIREVLQRNVQIIQTRENAEKNINLTLFLQELNKTASKNSLLPKTGRAYGDALKHFCLYLFITGGRLTYEILYKNLENSIPSISTLSRLLSELSEINEGCVRISKFKEYLDHRHYKLKFFLSEDQTAVVERVEYDQKNNRLVGLTAPSDTVSGFPNLKDLTVDSAKCIKEAFEKHDKSCNAYVFVAQPLDNGAPSFILSVFGSNNKFTGADVIKRWNHLLSISADCNIDLMGFSSDGDTRCLKAMKELTCLPMENENPYGSFFKVKYDLNRPNCIQDTVHIGTKLRTKLLKTGTTVEESQKLGLSIGNKIATVFHLEKLVELYSKDQHLLFNTHLDAKDKMNFEAVERMCSNKVLELLKSIPDSEATKQYLVITKDILDAFLNKELAVLDRVYKIWRSLFFLRIWRNWARQQKTIQKDFITSNSYTCIEINAHELLLIIEKCRDDPSSFLPWLFSSQPCEKVFRQTRALTATYCTQVNFTLLELLYRLNRIEALNEITTDFGKDYYFPREENKKLGFGNISQIEMPSIHEIRLTLTKAMNDAKDLASTFEIKNPDYESVDLKSVDKQVSIQDIDEDSGEEETDILNKGEKENASDDTKMDVDGNNLGEDVDVDGNNLGEDIDFLLSFTDLDIKEYPETSKGAFVKVVIGKNIKTVRKSALCWFYNNGKGRLSSDRLYRVRGMARGMAKGMEVEKTPKSKKPIKRLASKLGSKKKQKNAKLRKMSPRKKKLKDVASISTSSSSDDLQDDDFSLHSDSLSDSFSEDDETANADKQHPTLEKEQYYAVFFDEDWWVGRIINSETESESDTSTVKFLTKDLENLRWPKNDDIRTINNSFIFFGPIKLCGTYPFQLRRADENKIKIKYKEFKKRSSW